MQQKKSLLWFSSVLLLFTAITGVTSCSKKFDAPPASADQPIPDGYTQISVKDLKARHTVGGAFDAITDSVVLSVVVTANDKSGNLYKQLVVEDSTGGIMILLDQAGLYGPYPVGRKLWVKCKGLVLSDDNGLMELGAKLVLNGAPSLEGVESNRIREFIIGGSLNNPVVPHVVTLSDLTTNMQDKYLGSLIQLDGFEFTDADKTKTYADTSVYKKTVNLNVHGCSGSSVIVRTSAYASFAGLNVPDGNGKLTALYTAYGTTKQLILRDTSDVQFYANRCDGSSPIPTPGNRISIATLRSKYTGSDIKITDNYEIGGVVICDIANKNISGGSVILQDGNAGISVYFGGTLTYNIGDSVIINVSGDSLIKYRGSLEVKTPFGATAPAATTTGNVITPATKTIAELNTALATPLGSATNIEYTLVKIVDAAATPAGTYSGNKTLTDASGNIILFTRSAATFASNTLPTGNATWVGYASSFDATRQFLVRNASDVTGGGGPVGGDGINLGSSSPFILDFNGIGSGLPAGVSVRNAASASAVGTEVTFNSSASASLWNKTGVGFKNYASATGLTSAADSAAQVNSSDRALGVRQTSSAGYDPGSAFVFQIANTTGKTGVKLDFLLQSLDASTAPRTITWKIDYAVGDSPTSFTEGAATGTLTTGGNTFSSNPVSVNFGGALDNSASKVWIRIVTLTSSTGSGNRASSAIDNFKISWN